MRHGTTMTHKEAATLGWVRVDPKPWRTKLDARWEHRDGWRLQHCGHPTANTPWLLVDAEGRWVLSGVLNEGPEGKHPEHGRAWANLSVAMLYVDQVVRGALPPPAFGDLQGEVLR